MNGATNSSRATHDWAALELAYARVFLLLLCLLPTNTCCVHALHYGPSIPQRECYARHVSGDPASLGYYRALSDDLIYSPTRSSSNGDNGSNAAVDTAKTQAPGLGQMEYVPSEDIYLLRISALYAFLSTKTNSTTGEPYLYNSPGTNRMATAAAVLLAIQQFNNGDGSVIKEIENIHKRCGVRIVADFLDSETNTKTAVDKMTKQILFTGSSDIPQNQRHSPITTVLFGDYRSSITLPMASLSTVYGLPHVCTTCTTTELDDSSQFPLFGRYVPSDASTAEAIVSFALQRNAQSNPDNDDALRYMGVLYRNIAFGSSYYAAIKEAAEYGDRDIRVEGAHYTTTDDIDQAVETLAKTGYRIFVGVFYSSHYEMVMEAAMKYGIAGPGFVWILSDGMSTTRLQDKVFPAGSPLAIASQGVGIIKASGGMRTEGGQTSYDRMVDAWQSQTEDSIDYLNCVGHPTSNTQEMLIYNQAESDFFTNGSPEPPSSALFLYDATMSFGMAACSLLEEMEQEGGNYDAISGQDLMDRFLTNEFDGASGFVSVDPDTHSRRPESAFFHAFNAHGITEGNITAFSMDVVAQTMPLRDSNSTELNWVDVPGKAYRYSDGTTRFPYPLKRIAYFDENHLSPGVRGVFLFLATLILFLSVFFSGWTYYHRKSRVVRSSQPLFLHLICLGCFLMGCTIITLSIDDSVASVEGCSVACMLNPWFLAVGFVFAFSSLFAKEWRINKIFHNPSMKRMKVSTKDVMVPCIVLLFLNVLVLALWTGLSPLAWDRFYVGTIDKYERNLESIGQCLPSSGEASGWAPYVAILLCINMAMVLLANFAAYRARHISVEYSETKHITIIMVAILQAIAIGLPLVVLVSDDPTASFVVKSGLVFIICISFLLVMFIPKMIYLKDARKEAAKKEDRIRKSKERHEAFLARTRPSETSQTSATSAQFQSQYSRQSSDGTFEAGSIKVLRHPKTQEDQLKSLKEELDQAKSREEGMRKRIAQLERDQQADVEAPTRRQSSVTFASDSSSG